jgi:carboxynorspermidine decarboxylase
MYLLNKISPQVMTPAFIYDEAGIIQNINNVKQCINDDVCQLLFPLKSFSLIDALSLIGNSVDGFSVSSLFEARLARHVLGKGKSIHLTTPGLRSDEIDEIGELCHFISFNSLSQFENFQQKVHGKVSCGIRINPQLSFLKDKRYDPCRRYSKLGVPLVQLAEKLKNHSLPLDAIKGIHFHTNCESIDLEHLTSTLRHIENHLPNILGKIDWINMGGGYLFQEKNGKNNLAETLFLLKNKYDIEIYIEPGKAIVGNAGYIVSSVLDLFKSDGRIIAILDTSINHMPEIFEYQYEPTVMQASENGDYSYILAGSSCLAGDLFGQFRFDEPLAIGSRIVFEDVGSYTMVKANMFNGINLPTIYTLAQDGNVKLIRRFSYEDFQSRLGESNYVTS